MERCRQIHSHDIKCSYSGIQIYRGKNKYTAMQGSTIKQEMDERSFFLEWPHFEVLKV